MHTAIIAAVEESINELARSFAKKPYLHRCEHSIHFELFTILKGMDAIKDIEIKLDEKHTSQAVHKEWPESWKDKGQKGRRGNYDLAVLAAQSCSLEGFQHGRIRPVVAIEIGLNYCTKHIENDRKKLQGSDAERCYIVHFATGKGRQREVEETVTRLIAAENREPPRLQIVFVNTKSRRWRLLKQTAIEGFSLEGIVSGGLKTG